MRRNVTEKNVRHRALEDCKKAGVGPLAAMYVRSGYFIQRASCKPSREPMCPAARRMVIAVPDDLREKGTQGLHSRVSQVGVLPANHRASECALERCLEGFAALDGHKSMPSLEPMCPAGT